MQEKKSVQDAKLFLFFVKHVREREDREMVDFLVKQNKNIDEKTKRFTCVYCGCSFVYKKSLCGHMKRLHNINWF